MEIIKDLESQTKQLQEELKIRKAGQQDAWDRNRLFEKENQQLKAEKKQLEDKLNSLYGTSNPLLLITEEKLKEITKWKVSHQQLQNYKDKYGELE